MCTLFAKFVLGTTFADFVSDINTNDHSLEPNRGDGHDHWSSTYTSNLHFSAFDRLEEGRSLLLLLPRSHEEWGHKTVQRIYSNKSNGEVNGAEH